jgi:hypothetical protein
MLLQNFNFAAGSIFSDFWGGNMKRTQRHCFLMTAFYTSASLVLLVMITALSSCATKAVLSESFIDQKSLDRTGITIAEAVRDGGVMIAGKIPAKQRVAVLGITGRDELEASWVSDELIQLLVSARKHTVIDRRGLDVSMALKTSTGEIEERSAKEIGYLIGAEVVLYGNISYYQNQIRFLSLKAMDVRSGDIIAITSERFNAG